MTNLNLYEFRNLGNKKFAYYHNNRSRGMLYRYILDQSIHQLAFRSNWTGWTTKMQYTHQPYCSQYIVTIYQLSVPNTHHLNLSETIYPNWYEFSKADNSKLNLAACPNSYTIMTMRSNQNRNHQIVTGDGYELLFPKQDYYLRNLHGRWSA